MNERMRNNTLDSTMTIRQHMDAIADLLTERPPGQWTGWIVYILEVIESHGNASERAVVGMLTDLQDDIDVRLATGRWENGGS